MNSPDIPLLQFPEIFRQKGMAPTPWVPPRLGGILGIATVIPSPYY